MESEIPADSTPALAPLDLAAFEGHTPAPWYVGVLNDATYVLARPPRPSNDYMRLNADIEPIAYVYRPREGTWLAQQANARLIAAAPTLLAEVKRLRAVNAELREVVSEFLHAARREEAMGLRVRAAVEHAEEVMSLDAEAHL